MASCAATALETNSIIRENGRSPRVLLNAVRCTLFDDDYTSVRAHGPADG